MSQVLGKAVNMKAANARDQSLFGASLALTPDATTLAVGAAIESSGKSGINPDPNDTSAASAGAAYVFR